MKKELVWRLGSKLPTVDEVLKLIDQKIITNDEAKGIFFNDKTDEDRDKDSLKSEIKFLREVVDKLADKATQKTVVYETIQRYSPAVYYGPYATWGNGGILSTSAGVSALNLVGTCTGGTTGYNMLAGGGNTSATNCSFIDISTF